MLSFIPRISTSARSLWLVNLVMFVEISVISLQFRIASHILIAESGFDRWLGMKRNQVKFQFGLISWLPQIVTGNRFESISFSCNLTFYLTSLWVTRIFPIRDVFYYYFLFCWFVFDRLLMSDRWMKIARCRDRRAV